MTWRCFMPFDRRHGCAPARDAKVRTDVGQVGRSELRSRGSGVLDFICSFSKHGFSSMEEVNLTTILICFVTAFMIRLQLSADTTSRLQARENFGWINFICGVLWLHAIGYSAFYASWVPDILSMYEMHFGFMRWLLCLHLLQLGLHLLKFPSTLLLITSIYAYPITNPKPHGC